MNPLTFLPAFRRLFCLLYALAIVAGIHAQEHDKHLYKVLTLTGEKAGPQDLPQDHGVAGIWQRLLKLKTTASLLHTQAHPDDEHADLLTYAGRGTGARTALLSLNRGESGANILGSESYDQLGLLRTEEFLLAAAYYGLDDLYFTNLVDYGFSKRVTEAYEKWGKENVLAEMVRVIRINRPLVIVSRFHGTERDGHGNHQAAGEMTQLAFRMAADSSAFPEQILVEKLRPWKAFKLYRGGVRQAEPWNIDLNTGVYSPWLGQTYKNFSLLGYSMHRSQNGGQRNEVAGAFVQYYERMDDGAKKGLPEHSFFDGIDTTVTGIFRLTGERAPAGMEKWLKEIRLSVESAVSAFSPEHPGAIVRYLTNGLSATRAAISLIRGQEEALFLLQVKEKQFEDAISTVMGLQLQAIAVPTGTRLKRNFYEPLPTMGFAAAGQQFRVDVTVVNNSAVPLVPKDFRLLTDSGWKVKGESLAPGRLLPDSAFVMSYHVTVPEDAAFSKPYFKRQSMQDNHYELAGSQFRNLPWSDPAMQLSASFLVNGVAIQKRLPVQVRAPNLPYGYDLFTLKVAPAIAVNLEPRLLVIPASGSMHQFRLQVQLVNNFDSIVDGRLMMKLPEGWKSEPAAQHFSFTQPGEKINFEILVSTPAIAARDFAINAIALVNGKAYTQGYNLIEHRDIDQVMEISPAIATIKGIDVKVAPALKIGYVMGVGDDVPGGLRQLGAIVTLLSSTDLATAALGQYDVIMIGTRAYAVRQDLAVYNRRLLDYAKNGGHLVVLFQTPEFVPGRMAPFPADLPGNPEEVAEEDSPVEILDSRHRVLNYPNTISKADFDGWVEQRGSKFFATWDSAYVPIISTQDAGQAPQHGGWLMARYGKGYYTYCAYSFHRQMPYGVAGIFRIMANLISYGKQG